VRAGHDRSRIFSPSADLDPGKVTVRGRENKGVMVGESEGCASGERGGESALTIQPYCQRLEPRRRSEGRGRRTPVRTGGMTEEEERASIPQNHPLPTERKRVDRGEPDLSSKKEIGGKQKSK